MPSIYFKKRFQISSPITLSLMFDPEELGFLGMMMGVKAQLSQPCPYSTNLVALLGNAKTNGWWGRNKILYICMCWSIVRKCNHSEHKWILWFFFPKSILHICMVDQFCLTCCNAYRYFEQMHGQQWLEQFPSWFKSYVSSI